MLGALRLLVFATAMIVALPSVATTVPAKGGSSAGNRTGDPTARGRTGVQDTGPGQTGDADANLNGALKGIPTAPVPNTTTPVDANPQDPAVVTDPPAVENPEIPTSTEQTADALLDQYAADENLVEQLPIMEKMRHARE